MPSAQVLVIDDDRRLVEVIIQMLRVLGHSVRTAQSAAEGLAAMAATPPDVVLLDLGLPGISGFDALPYLRHHHPEVPVILMTAVFDSEAPRLAQANGAFGLLAKPFGLAELGVMLDRATQRGSEHEAAPPDRRRCSRCGQPIRQGDSVANFSTGTMHMRCVPPQGPGIRPPSGPPLHLAAAVLYLSKLTTSLLLPLGVVP